MTLEKKAEYWAAQRTVNKSMLCHAYMRAYMAGAKENGVAWHDLRKDPNDLPEDKFFRITDHGIGFYDRFSKQWYFWNGNEMVYPPVAWCEIPEFEEDA